MSHKTHGKIHGRFREHAPKSVERAKKLFSFKYPKLFLLVVLTLLAYYIFTQPFIQKLIEGFNGLGHFGVFLSGMLTSFGFTAAFGIGLLSKMNTENMLLATLVAGLGATVIDLILFKSMKLSFLDEFKKLEKTRLFKEVKGLVKKDKHVLIRHYLLYIFAGLILATPLPDEVGISMLAGLTTIKPFKLAVIGFVLHSLSIFIVLSVI